VGRGERLRRKRRAVYVNMADRFQLAERIFKHIRYHCGRQDDRREVVEEKMLCL
jgi:hypothetical protein